MRRWLPVILILLVLFGCGEDASQFQELVADCNSAAASKIINWKGSSAYLCLKQNIEDSDRGIKSGPLYVYSLQDGKIGKPDSITAGNWKAFEDRHYQDFFDDVQNPEGNNIFYPMIRGGNLMVADDVWPYVEAAVTENDWKDASSIMLGAFFGNNKRGTGKSTGEGAVAMDGDGGNNFDTQPSETGYQLKRNSVDVSYLTDGDAAHYGLDPGHNDDTQVQSGLGAGQPIPAMLKCSSEYSGNIFSFDGSNNKREVYFNTKKSEGDGWGENQFLCEHFNCATYSSTEKAVVLQRVDIEYSDDYAEYMDKDTAYVTGFVCTKQGNVHKWVTLQEFMETDDEDNDGTGSVFDCDDEDPFKFYPTDFLVTVNTDSVDFGESSELRNICGDNVDNFCSWEGPFGNHARGNIIREVLEDNGMIDDDDNFNLNLEDDCDLNPFACENNCLRKGAKCDYLTVPNSDPNLADEEYDDEEPTDEPPVVDDELDYSDFETGVGFCCGDSIDDMGTISDDGESLCVKNENTFVSSKEDSQMSSVCQTPWCWLNALDAPFEVLTVKQENSFNDYVSNYQEWNICNASNLGNLEYPISRDGLDDSNYFKTSRFSCLQSGDTFMFAECVSNETFSGSDDTRTRTMGQSRLSFHVSGTLADLNDYGQSENGYGDIGMWDMPYGVDLSQYEYLEFYVKFDKVVDYYPIALNISVISSDMSDGEKVELYNQNVLGYSDFPYLVEGEYVRVRVPIGNWVDVKEIQFTPNPQVLTEHMSIKTVQAIAPEESELYCSGQQANTESYTFINGIDENADMNADINSEDICKSLFGEDAWFGFNSGSSPEVEEMYAACCGNDANEYYVGDTNYLDGKGCFNSEVMYDGQRAANVQYTVLHQISEPVISKVPEPLSQVNVETGYDDFGNILVPEGEYWGRTLIGSRTAYIGTSDFKEDNDALEEAPENMYWYDPYTRKQLRGEIYYYDQNLLFELQLYHEYKELSVTSSVTSETSTYTVPCLEDQCVYALPGQPPYEITNNFPGLYDLYFVVGGTDEEQYLITEPAQRFEMYGNILARRVSKNVLMTNETFYSCEVPEYYFDTGYEAYSEQGSRCDVQNGYVCSPQDAESLINTWSNIDLDEIGYTEVTEFVEGMEFQPRTCGAQDPCDVTELSHYVSPVPGRNLVSNANFYASDGNNIVGWIMYGGQFDTDSLPYRENVSMVVPSGYSLKSAKISVYDTTYTVSADTSCTFNVYGYTKEGVRSVVGESFNGADLEYIELSFEGNDCTVSSPYVSVGSSLSEDFDDRYSLRSGAACCPEGACWNGYICVENMASYTFMTENVGDEAYRCIDGDWYNLPPLHDWNGDEVGYCESEGQCFVTSSLSEGIMENASYSDFYNGEYPACINDGEYIFDHLCQDGEWSSRTKFVASSLLNYADGDDHILYCTNVRDALLDYKEDGYNYANYIEGESTTVVEETSSLDEAFDGSLSGNTTVSICYPELTVSETGRRLVPDMDNTCVNNVCTIKFDSGGWKTMWGTSVNIDPRDSQSLFVPLGVPGSDTESFCYGDENQWVECNDNIWFQDSMDSIIYTDTQIGMSQTVTESIVSFLSDLFSADTLEDSEDYLEQATNFNKVYIASVEDYTVRAIEEVDGDQETIVAEYTGFETPVCDYVYNVNPSMVYVEQWPAVPEFLVNCTSTEDMSTVVTGTNRDFWWPQLTGMLRIE